MADPAKTVDQNILPVQALFNIDNSFNTFIGQGQPFIVSATESIGIQDVPTLNATLYFTLSPVSTGQVTSLDVASTKLTFNPSTSTLSVPFVSGALKGTADTATNIANGSTGQIPYQTSANVTGFISNGTSGQVLTSNGSSAPSWSTPTFLIPITDDTTTNAVRYPLFSAATIGNITVEYTSSTKYQFNPSTGVLTATGFSGSGAALTSLTAANLSGTIPSAVLGNSNVYIGTTAIALNRTSASINLTGTSIDGSADSANTATTATNATNIAITDNTSSVSTYYPVISSATTGNVGATTSSTKFSFVPSTGTLTTSALVTSGGTIDNTAIGGTTPAAGVFTTLTATGQTSLGGVAGSEGLRVVTTASGVNWVQIAGGASGVSPSIQAAGNSRPLTLSGFGANGVDIYSNSGSTRQFAVSHTAFVVNYVQVTGAATNNRPTASSQGSDADIGFNIVTKGSGTHNFASDANIGTSQFQVTRTQATAVNYLTATGAATNFSPRLYTQGSDTNISQVFQSKGTGAIDLAAGSSGVNISNGGTVTAITGTAGGSYTTVPTFTISAPTTAGGVQATGTCAMAALTITLQAGGSGYAIGDTITLTGGTFTQAIILTVATLSGSAVATFTTNNGGTYTVLPTNPIAQGSTSGAGTGATFNVTAWQVRTTAFTITAAGSGYVEQPTITFSSGSATAYATVGGTVGIRSLGQNLDFYTPINATGGAPSFRIYDNQSSGTGSYVSVRGATTSALMIALGNANAQLQVSSNGTGAVSFSTNANSQEQFRVAHTASAVNYVQVTGRATGNGPQISAQGSDGNANLEILSKGNGAVKFFTGTREQFRIVDTAGTIVNYATATGSATGAAPIFSVAGTDADINLTLTPKGTGSVVATAPVRLQGYTVATLPTAGTIGRTAYVTDAVLPTYLGTLTGGGTVKTPVFDNGTAWVSY